MPIRKRAVLYSGLVIVLALVLSAALLQLNARAIVQAAPLAQEQGYEYSITIIKDAIPDSSQPFTFNVYIYPNEVLQAAFSADFELVDDGIGVSNTKTITELLYTPGASVSIEEYPTENWLPTGVQCEDETGAPVDVNDNNRAAAAAFPGKYVSVGFGIEAGKQYTCTFTNGAPAIVLTKTVGTDPAACASTDEITVVAGTQVNYCYTVQNTGGVSLTMHSLLDDQLDTLLSDFAYTLTPGASIFFTQTATPPVTTTNVATWTSWMTYSMPVPTAASAVVDAVMPVDVYTLTATATDSAKVNVEPPDPSIAVIKTVGTQAGVCAATPSLAVKAGTVVYYCYTVQNTGNVPLPLHSLVDSDLGAPFTGLAYDLAPGSSVNTVQAGVIVSKTVDVAVTNVATWTAYAGNSVTAQSVTGVDTAVVTLEPTALDTDDAPPNRKLFLPQIGR